MNILVPSILAADFMKLGEEVSIVEESGLTMLHIDVMDGWFVPSISFGFPIIESLRKKTNLILDVHLMIEEPERYVKKFAKNGADIITVHAEACVHLQRAISQIKKFGKKCCVALSPATPLTALDYVLEDLDMVLIMTVNPGFGGQDFIPAMYRKISDLREILIKKGLSIDIEVDGGVRLSNVKDIVDAGANVLVAGSSVFRGDAAENIKEFQKILCPQTDNG